VNETRRGLTIFLSALVTLWLWAPLSSDSSRAADGTITTKTYFGPLHYLTLHAELKEPQYSITRNWNNSRLAATIGLTVLLWTAVLWKIRRNDGPGSVPDS
jgi:hypothetical protein